MRKIFRLPKELSRWLFFAGVVRFSSEIFVFFECGQKKSLLAILTKRQTDFPEIDCLFFSAAVSAIINNKILLEDLYNHTYIGCGVH